MTTQKPLPSDLEIARQADLWPMAKVAQEAGIPEEDLIPYGRHVAKVDLDVLDKLKDRPQAKMIVVTAVTPTPLGEGKTTTSVGLAQGMAAIGENAMLTLRQPSMGPTFGVKGGAAGGGYSQIVPMETLNLHLTGDFHAITAAHNLLAAMIDAHLFHGNELNLDPQNISWRRVIDMNDRALRSVMVGLGPKEDGVPRQTGFDITAASEIMVIVSLCSGLRNLRERLGRIVVGFTYSGNPVTAKQIGAAGAMTAILKDAIQPNLMQTLEHTPALIHAGPFGNIATGNSSVLADLVGSRVSDYVITEAGFGADMGAERFFNVKCRVSGLTPSAAVLVVTVRALKTHSGRYRIVPGRPLPADMLKENPDDVLAGADNLRKHIEIVKSFGVTPVVAINVFHTDFDSEHAVIEKIAQEAGVRVAKSYHVVRGGAGAKELAQAVVDACGEDSTFTPTYEMNEPLITKIEKVARGVYGADGIELSAQAKKDLKRFEELGYGNLPVVIAKTHLSISSDPSLKGAPTGWTLPVREVRAAVGAGYVYAICGDMRTMPGLGKTPAAKNIDIDENGEIQGLF
ncbi:formate--tetrahydrofolate ligase [Deinococcus radiophilus]|uniref:Formate--tetrahydrofolate ligase n=1 Tax=Deinococcus radiophilus TaxID=32062 RepID=A0A431VS82_9DEIO|nr:formate--tetrahydrofolate ligase [Deinococcus radiophilus]RTR26108.1 formate--tetrahydrofolate ligase [Deinococcus radiophilus]UFA51586.1 formate--tetrahydrofolate ligase [Deinococcus radiophilus]